MLSRYDTIILLEELNKTYNASSLHHAPYDQGKKSALSAGVIASQQLVHTTERVALFTVMPEHQTRRSFFSWSAVNELSNV